MDGVVVRPVEAERADDGIALVDEGVVVHDIGLSKGDFSGKPIIALSARVDASFVAIIHLTEPHGSEAEAFEALEATVGDVDVEEATRRNGVVVELRQEAAEDFCGGLKVFFVPAAEADRDAGYAEHGGFFGGGDGTRVVSEQAAVCAVVDSRDDEVHRAVEELAEGELDAVGGGAVDAPAVGWIVDLGGAERASEGEAMGCAALLLIGSADEEFMFAVEGATDGSESRGVKAIIVGEEKAQAFAPMRMSSRRLRLLGVRRSSRED